MNDNELKTKENRNETKDNIEPHLSQRIWTTDAFLSKTPKPKY